MLECFWKKKALPVITMIFRRRKAAEKRMVESLFCVIVNYARPVRSILRRVILRNSGKNMRKKFCSTRLLRMFDEMGVNLTAKSCRQSTQNCWKKRKTYSEYRRSRENARTAKANVDRVLKMEVEQDVEKVLLDINRSQDANGFELCCPQQAR